MANDVQLVAISLRWWNFSHKVTYPGLAVNRTLSEVWNFFGLKFRPTNSDNGAVCKSLGGGPWQIKYGAAGH